MMRSDTERNIAATARILATPHTARELADKLGRSLPTAYSRLRLLASSGYELEATEQRGLGRTARSYRVRRQD